MKKSKTVRARNTVMSALVLALVLVGCAPMTNTTTGQYDENFRFVPRIHVENNSFGTTAMDYKQCSYDTMYEGYWCRIDR